MTIQRTDALVKDELDRLTANFFRAVTFDEGDAPQGFASLETMAD